MMTRGIRFSAILGAMLALLSTPPAKGTLLAEISLGDLGTGLVGSYNSVGFTIFGNDGGTMYTLFDGRTYRNADAGRVFVIDSVADDPDFEALNAFFTDGVNGDCGSSYGLPGGMPGASVLLSEAYLFGTPGTDAIGQTIGRYELTINALHIASPGSNPNGDGNWTDSSYNYTIRIYSQDHVPGVPAGDVSTAAMLAGSLFSLVIGFRRTKS